MLIGLSEDLDDARAAGVRCAATPVPPFAGRCPGHPLVSVRGFLLTRSGANRLVARDLMPDYLTRTDVARTLTSRLATPSCLRRFDAGDGDLRALRGDPGHGLLMPVHPRMTEAWRPIAETFARVIDGDDPAACAQRLDERLREILNG
jgi:maltose-binding protein MalE